MDIFDSIATPADRTDSLAWDDVLKVHYRTADAILAHPNFPAARLTYLEQMDGIYGDTPFLNKLMMEGSRSLLFFLVICMANTYREEDRATWPTLANFRRRLMPMGMASAGHIGNLIARMLQVGFLSSAASSTDGRVRLLTPTATMLAHDRDWLAAHYAPLALLYGDDDYRRPVVRDETFQAKQRQIAAMAFAHLAAPLLANPFILFLAGHDAAFLIVATLVIAASRSEGEKVQVPYAELARRHAVSRTHVRRLLAEAQDGGWLIVEGKAQHVVTLLPGLWQGLDRFIADGMSNHDRTARAVDATTEERSVAT